MESKFQDWEKREIGSEAVWSLSTAKPGNGVEQVPRVFVFVFVLSCFAVFRRSCLV
jgi:hypothetical protein